jgi:hypothetical protein
VGRGNAASVQSVGNRLKFSRTRATGPIDQGDELVNVLIGFAQPTSQRPVTAPPEHALEFYGLVPPAQLCSWRLSGA